MPWDAVAKWSYLIEESSGDRGEAETSMSRRSYSKVTSSKKRRKIQCFVFNWIFYDDYRKEHNLKYHEKYGLESLTRQLFQSFWREISGGIKTYLKTTVPVLKF